jgi:hypothetical protein
MTTDKKPLTHTAYAFKREGRRTGRWVEVGMARLNAESGGVMGHHVYLDRTPIGGYTGHIYLLPIGVKPGDPPQPLRPADRPADDDEDF